MSPPEKSLQNPPNKVSTVTAGCDCDVCTLTPFDADVGSYTKDDMNAVFQMLIGEATSPNRAKQLGLSATSEDHAKEAFGIASAIMNRAKYDKGLMAKYKQKAPVKWGFESDGTPLGVAKSGKVIAYTAEHHKKYFDQAKKLGEISKGKPYCEWLVILKEQAKKAAENPSSRNEYNEWRTHNPKTSAGRTTLLGTDLWKKKLDYPDLMND